MKTLFSIFLSFASSVSFSQELIDFVDTTNFHMTHLNDTIDNYWQTSHADSIHLDLNCDFNHDIKIRSYQVSPGPVPFPSIQYVEILNYIGSDLEFSENIYPTGEFVDLDTISNWESKSRYVMMCFSIFDGISWIGNFDDDRVNLVDYNLLFRFKDNNQYTFGWINFNCRSYVVQLAINKIAFDKSSCLNTSLKEIQEPRFKLYPNPFSDHLHIQADQIPLSGIFWKVYGINGRFICEGKLEPYTSMISINNKIDKPGIYIIQFFAGDKLTNTHLIRKI